MFEMNGRWMSGADRRGRFVRDKQFYQNLTTKG